VFDITWKKLKGLDSYGVTVDVTHKNQFILKQSAIFLFDSFEKFWSFRQAFNFSSSVASPTIRNLVFCSDGSSNQIEKIFQDFELQFKHNQTYTSKSHLWTFLIHENGKLSLRSFTMFSAQLCNSLQLLKVNEFSVKTLKWTSENYFAADGSNFHGCEIVFGMFYDWNKPLHWLTLLMTEAFAQSLNYSIDINTVSMQTGQFKTSKRVDFFMYLNTMNENFENNFISSPFAAYSYGLTVPYGEPYTPVEKLFLPFEIDVWLCFLLTFAIAYFFIFFVKKFSAPEVGNFIWGESVQTPTLNVFMIFMGGGMVKLPWRNLARFILMAFILFCLVMR
jgi:hypothetical protein